MKRTGLTLTDCVAALLVMGATTALLLAPLSSACIPASLRTGCGARLRLLAQACNRYALESDRAFPIAGVSDPDLPLTGFQGSRLATPAPPRALANNVTGSIWMLARQGRVMPDASTCPKTTDVPNDAPSPASRLDFDARENLSYSTENMYAPNRGGRWTLVWAKSTRAIFADNNANDYAGSPARHTLSSDAAEEDIRKAENSPNHEYLGQNVAYGDGHVEWRITPFAGASSGDNIYAVKTKDGAEAPPSVANIATEDDDSVLIPLSGNGGGAGSLSGLGLDVRTRAEPPRGRAYLGPSGIIAITLFIVVIGMFLAWMVRVIREGSSVGAP